MRQTLFTALAVLLLLTACGEGKKQQEAAPLSDSLTTDTLPHDSDSIVIDNVPLAADGLFDDFIYGYMQSRKRQMERTVFPLPVKKDGKETLVQQADWKFDRLFSKMDMYMVLYQDERSVGIEKDTALKEVGVEMLDLKAEHVKQYLFRKERGQWRLTSIDEHALHQNANSDFYGFYKQFAASPKFQRQHIRNPFAFKTYDTENFTTIEGTLDVVQWQDYAPQFPQGIVATINYGQRYHDSDARVLVLSGMSSGMSCTLVFKKLRGRWMMTKLSN